MEQAGSKFIHDQATLTDWLGGSDLRKPIEDGALACDAAITTMNREHMEEVARRIRMQLKFIVAGVRSWRARHEGFSHPVRQRYSAYEGALCLHDLQRHWALYRHAMKEWGQYKRDHGEALKKLI